MTDNDWDTTVDVVDIANDLIFTNEMGVGDREYRRDEGGTLYCDVYSVDGDVVASYELTITISEEKK